MRKNIQKLSHEEIPGDFSGLIYPPSDETGVYLLLGLLWEHIPIRLAIESFEIDPKREKYAHTKVLDAKGKRLVDGTWKDVTIEFKLHSSGFLRDMQIHDNCRAKNLSAAAIIPKVSPPLVHSPHQFAGTPRHMHGPLQFS